MPSWTDADVGVGLIKGRKFRQVKIMRPRFNAGSIKFAGNETWASARFDCLISSLSPSGQFSESAANGAEMAPGSTGICGAGAGEGMGATGFGAPLLRDVIKLVAGVGVCGTNCRAGGIGALVAGVGACGTNCRAGGIGALVAGAGAGGTNCRAGGVGALVAGAGVCGTNCRAGGIGALVAGVMPRAGNENAGGVVIRSCGMSVDGVGLAATEILAPSPPAPNGPVMSSVISTCFWAERRDSRAGFNRVRISWSGSITGLWSCSPPELTNTPGAAFRNSPKAIFTEPNASCVRIFSSGTATIAPAGGACMTFARKSIGIAARMDCRGSCNASGFSTGVGGIMEAGSAGGAVCGRMAAADAATASERGVSGAVALSSSRRRSRPRSIPANLIFTLFDMVLMLYWRPVNRLLDSFSRKHAMVGFLPDLATRTFKSFKREHWSGGKFVSALDFFVPSLLTFWHLDFLAVRSQMGTPIASLK